MTSPSPLPPSSSAPAGTAPASPIAYSLGRAPRWALPVAVTGGILGAIQARINSTLASRIEDGFTAAAISFGTGLVIVVAIVLARPGLRAGTVDFVRDLRGGRFPWILTLGGLGGATFVLGQGLVVGVLGVSLYIVCVVAGQTVTGLVVDRLGIGPGGVRPLTWPRVIGAGLMVVSVVLAMSGGIRTDVPAVLLVLPVVAGIAMGLQQAFNGRVTQHTGKFMVATLGNFVVGTTALVVAAILHALVVGHGPGRLPAEPVLYLGGAIGVAFIAMAAYLAGPLGVLTLAMSTIAGQIVGSVVLDLLIPAADAHVGILTLLGAALTLIAALVTAGMRIRRGPRSHGTAAG